jgi:hypothetical protein
MRLTFAPIFSAIRAKIPTANRGEAKNSKKILLFRVVIGSGSHALTSRKPVSKHPEQAIHPLFKMTVV